MKLPIYGYGHSVLKKVCEPIDSVDEEIEKLIEDMWETMYNAQGVGLAAPQIGKPIRIFLIDTIQTESEDSEFKGIKKVFINAEMIEEKGKEWPYEEGCLSIPDVRADVMRNANILIKYQDENLKVHEDTFDGINARVIQHEYDHIEGILFTTKIKPLKRRLIKRKLEAIGSGNVQVDYRMRFSKKK